jgi:MFS family permease
VIRIGTIGAKALYFLFAWLISAAAAAWLADRKGYGERVGLTLGLLLAVLGLLIMLFLPGRPGSTWKVQGWLPRRRQNPRRGSASSLARSCRNSV